MQFCQQVFCLFLTIIVLCEALEVNISSCVKRCKDEKLFKRQKDFCSTTYCVQKYLGSLVKNANSSESTLPKPVAPKLVEAGWQKIRVRFNTTELKNHSDVDYILEVKPLWGRQERGQHYVVFPYIKPYLLTNHTTYTIEDLEPNTGYKFRVLALKQNRWSTFSNWSSVMNTTEVCEEPPCGVTNIRLELTTEIPYQKRVILKSLFRWKRSTSFSETNKTRLPGVHREIKVISECRKIFNDENKFSESKNTGLDTFIKKENASFVIDGKDHLYYNCWYKLEMEAVDKFEATTLSLAKRKWIFHIPKCIKISKTIICGCEYEFGGDKVVTGQMNVTYKRTSEKTATVHFTWNDEIWRNLSSFTYHAFTIYRDEDFSKPEPKPFYMKYYNVTSKVSSYNATSHNLTIGKKYDAYIKGFADHHCEHVERHNLYFTVGFPCENKVCPSNSSCRRVGNHGKKSECRCHSGLVMRNQECIDEKPCEKNPCGPKETCKPIAKTGKYNCTCEGMYRPLNGTCEDICVIYPCDNKTEKCIPNPDTGKGICICKGNLVRKNGICVLDEKPCEKNPCGPKETCKPIAKTGKYNCTCEGMYRPLNGTCEDICVIYPCDNKTEKCIPNAATGTGICICKGELVKKNGICVSETKSKNVDVILVAVLTPLAVILIAIIFIVWLRRCHKKQLSFIETEFENAMETIISNRSIINVRSIDIDLLGDGVSAKEMNLIYVSQDNIYEIPEYILEPISRYELPPDSVRFRGLIGKGAFGRVYAGEALGINGNPEVTAVAIKTLKESANEEELSNFLREIDLMKDLGIHENVINMYGCCTKCRPVCLVLEYAPGGNLLNHLRALKKKCKDIVAAQSDKVMNSTNDHAEDFHAEISIRIKEEIRAALDSKELESFSHQIAAGMKHISDHGIVHRDLAARNILLGKDKILKISDFGLSREETYVQKPSGKVPYRWLAIEAIQERSYSTASDVWAFGVVLWEICTLGEIPYSGVSDRQLLDFLRSGKRLEKVENCTDDIYKIMSRCWSHLPEDRPTFGALYEKLWELRNKGKIYVNIDSLMKQSLETEDHGSSEETSESDNSAGESIDHDGPLISATPQKPNENSGYENDIKTNIEQ
ncbi:receptor tyrosine-protein kinase let-23-like isoform X2 [Dendronephthya gigantea]|uniref:receptor tyrosine-protein kinase let-23-like isoform X2 n=1 Tax=Dendronephthya gigantea TaxID=151771 RepID=UPI00106A20A3|nr:receptor tyrosine-protein kinase let-23-like isoform X2 [Dendronephthya gigantea]